MDFKIWPNIQIVKNGSSALIYCVSVIPATWTHDGKPLSTVSNSLLLPLVTNGNLPSGQKFFSDSIIIFPEDPLTFIPGEINPVTFNHISLVRVRIYGN